VAVFAVIYFNVKKADPQTGPSSETANNDPESLLKSLGLPEDSGPLPFEINDEIKTFATKAAGGKDGEEALRALFDAIIEKGNEGYFRPYHQREPRTGDVFSAKELVVRFSSRRETPIELSSYELASLMLAVSRGMDLDTQMVEIHQFVGEKKPADPGGKLGRFGVSIKGAEKQTNQESGASVYDPFGRRVAPVSEVNMTPLSDREAVAPFFGLKALALLADQDTAQALKLNETAVELAPNNPYLRSGRGLIFAASGAPGEAVAEFEKAVKLRDDPVFRTNLAELFLLVDPTGRRAELEVQAAIEKMPDFARAHALLAMVLMMQQQASQAEQELTIAQNLDPTSPTIAMFWAQFYLGKRDSERAIEKANEAVRLSESSISSMLGLAQIYRATARFDEMRSTLDKVLKKSESPVIANQIREIFDYDPNRAEDEEMPGLGTDLELKLGGDNPGLGGNLELGEGMGGGLGGDSLKLNTGLGNEDMELKLDLNKKQ
jgi:Tfp pilus assembly protein PilF